MPPFLGLSVEDKLLHLEKIFLSHKHTGTKPDANKIPGSALLGPITLEKPSGTVNDSNTTFTLANTPVAGYLIIFADHLVSFEDEGFSLSGKTVTMETAPTNWIRALYLKA